MVPLPHRCIMRASTKSDKLHSPLVLGIMLRKGGEEEQLSTEYGPPVKNKHWLHHHRPKMLSVNTSLLS